ncbi:MAG: ribosome-associated translation inhibitor RaiA [Chloroflexi bacterium]|nr:ribosome-associated translation inhibitor RaiA [Chloroflexota bacterium]
MEIQIKSHNIEISDQLRAQIEKKVSKLERFLPNIDEARVDLSVQQTKSADDRQIVQLTLRTNSTILRAEERASDLYTSLDTALERMTRQIERYKGRHWRSQNRAVSEPAVVEEQQAEEEEELIIRRKSFQTRPMTVEEAIEQMELLGHDFFVFYDAATKAFCVVYRRRDSGYGLLLPELA